VTGSFNSTRAQQDGGFAQDERLGLGEPDDLATSVSSRDL
jgi:hypothetical protein